MRETMSKGEVSLAQFWFVLPRRSQALDNLIQWLIRSGSPRRILTDCLDKESDGASGVNVGHIRGEEFAAEDCHLLNVLHHVSSSQLHLKGQRIHEQFCDSMARDPELLMRLALGYGGDIWLRKWHLRAGWTLWSAREVQKRGRTTLEGFLVFGPKKDAKSIDSAKWKIAFSRSSL